MSNASLKGCDGRRGGEDGSADARGREARRGESSGAAENNRAADGVRDLPLVTIAIENLDAETRPTTGPAARSASNSPAF